MPVQELTFLLFDLTRIEKHWRRKCCPIATLPANPAKSLSLKLSLALSRLIGNSAFVWLSCVGTFPVAVFRLRL
jgi:hypothetical protein